MQAQDEYVYASAGTYPRVDCGGAGEHKIEILHIVPLYEEGNFYKGVERLQRHQSNQGDGSTGRLLSC